jgi:hypothetical protein
MASGTRPPWEGWAAARPPAKAPAPTRRRRWPWVVGVLAGLFVFVALSNRLANAAAGPTGPKCHPSYKLKCLKPNAYDYDCIGGRGNGPLYTGLVKVVGPDVFRLDTDHDGWGCERD